MNGNFIPPPPPQIIKPKSSPKQNSLLNDMNRNLIPNNNGYASPYGYPQNTVHIAYQNTNSYHSSYNPQQPPPPPPPPPPPMVETKTKKKQKREKYVKYHDKEHKKIKKKHGRLRCGTLPDNTNNKISSHLRLIRSKRTEKTFFTVSILKECLSKEVLFEGMDNNMINEIIDAMYRVDCAIGECIIRQSEYGDAYFVIECGAFSIIHQEMEGAPKKIVGQMLPGKAFGEGSLLYSIPRAATLQATKPCIVWALDATKFLEVRQKISQRKNDKRNKIVRYLKKIELFQQYHDQDLVAIGQATSQRKYAKNSRIVKQGDDATEFFLIKTGSAVAVIKNDDGTKQAVKKYYDGDYFGERGIYKNEKRAASIIATSTIRCYVIKAVDFQRLLANSLSEKFEKQIEKYDNITFDDKPFGKKPSDDKTFDHGTKGGQFGNLIDCKLEEFEVLGILGVGAFGRVSLVKDPKTLKTYSLKKMRKNKIIENKQEQHVRNERAVLAILDSNFCVQFFGSYQDELNIYLLMEPVLGGELFTLLRHNGSFSEKTARFYAACVVLAFESLHCKNIIYRDLKPENLLISNNGYCKLSDYGFAKKRNNSCTLCGTPQYLAPEIIQNYPHSFSVDWWALGIFIYEMIIGHVPFEDDPNIKMYEKILTFDIEFPSKPKLSERCQYVISGLLEKNSVERLGAGTNINGTQQILKHPWFDGLNWNKMRMQKCAAPYIPDINGHDDLSHFHEYPEENVDDKLNPDPNVYKWCQDF